MPGRRGSIRSADRLLSPAVAETLRNLPEGPDSVKDAATRRLSAEYAASIDDAAVTRDLALAAMEQIEPGDEFVRKAYTAVLRDLEHRKILVDLGPKLLDSLNALGATPASRARIERDKPAGLSGTGKTSLELAREAHSG